MCVNLLYLFSFCDDSIVNHVINTLLINLVILQHTPKAKHKSTSLNFVSFCNSKIVHFLRLHKWNIPFSYYWSPSILSYYYLIISSFLKMISYIIYSNIR